MQVHIRGNQFAEEAIAAVDDDDHRTNNDWSIIALSTKKLTTEVIGFYEVVILHLYFIWIE